MSLWGVYKDGMSRQRITDLQVEQVFAGQLATDTPLSAVVPLVQWLRRLGEVAPPPDRVDAVAVAAAAAVTERAMAEGPSPVGRRVLAQPRRRLTPAFALPLALVLVLSTFTGAAVAAQGSAPGDPMYVLNIALERIGIGRGGLEERLDEAVILADRGRHDEALVHAARALIEQGTAGSQATEALAGLAEAVDKMSNGTSAEARGMVVEMLTWMIDNAGLIHDPEAEPGAFGKGVSEMAHRIAEERRGGRPENPGPPQGLPPNHP